MPKYTKRTARMKAKSLVKPLIKNGMNESKTARELGISPQAVNERLRHKPVQDVLQEFLDSPELDQLLLEVASQGLCAEKPVGAAILISKDGEIEKAEEQGAIRMPDHNSRHKFWHDCMVIKNKIKDKTQGESKNGVYIYIVKDGDTEKCESNRIQIHPACEPEVHQERQVSV